MSPPNLWYLPPAFFSAGGPWGRRAPGLSCALDCRGLSVWHSPGMMCRGKAKVSRCERLGDKSGTCEPRRSLIGYRPRRARWQAQADDPRLRRGRGATERLSRTGSPGRSRSFWDLACCTLQTGRYVTGSDPYSALRRGGILG